MALETPRRRFGCCCLCRWRAATTTVGGDDARAGRFRRRAPGQARDHRRGLGPGHRRGRGRAAEDVIAKLDAPPLPERPRRFVDWVAAYTLAPPGAVLRMAMSVLGGARAAARSSPVFGCRPAVPRAADELTRRAPARARPCSRTDRRAPADLAREAGVGNRRGQGDGLAGVLETVSAAAPAFAGRIAERPGPTCHGAGGGGAESGRARCGMAASRRPCSTASPAPARPRSISRRSPRRLRAGTQALVLLPEIALTAQWLERFAQRFGVPPAQWHSDLPRRAARHLARRRDGRGARRRRRALGAVPALPRSRPHRRRRGA